MKLHVPYYTVKTKINVNDQIVDVNAYQIIVWISIASDATSRWESSIPKFPAILDIGNNHNLAVTEKHLLDWAGIQSASLIELDVVREKGKRVPLVDAGLWLHMDAKPFRLTIEEGIAVYDGDWPRLPILGLRALTNSKLQTFIYGNSKRVVIRTPPKWNWPF